MPVILSRQKVCFCDLALTFGVQILQLHPHGLGIYIFKFQTLGQRKNQTIVSNSGGFCWHIAFAIHRHLSLSTTRRVSVVLVNEEISNVVPNLLGGALKTTTGALFFGFEYSQIEGKPGERNNRGGSVICPCKHPAEFQCSLCVCEQMSNVFCSALYLLLASRKWYLNRQQNNPM